MAGNAEVSITELNAVGIHEILERDLRPTFVLDLNLDWSQSTTITKNINPIFFNNALRSSHDLLDAIVGTTDYAATTTSEAQALAGFRSWIIRITQNDDIDDGSSRTYFYLDLLWTVSTIRNRWQLISGSQCYQVSDLPTRKQSDGPPADGTNGGNIAELVSAAVKPPAKSPNDIQSHDFSLRSLARQTSYFSAPNYRNGTADTSLALEDQYMENSRPIIVSSPSSSRAVNKGPTVASLTLTEPETSVPDWTVPKPKGKLSEFLAHARQVDWAATSLGAMNTWTPEFRQAANLVMGNPYPAALFWGNELTMLYNEAYKNEVAGNKHPALMGTGFEGPFKETWDALRPLFEECATTGESIRRENDQLFIERYGFLEETYFSWSFTPLYGGTSKIVGFYNAPFDTTAYSCGQRRMRTLQKLGQMITFARTIKEFWKCVLDGLKDNPFDVPFALLYSVMDSDDSDAVSISSDSTFSVKSCVYEGSISVPAGHPAAPPKLDLKRSREGFIPSFREAMRTREPTKLQTQDGTLPEALLKGIRSRGFGDPCKEAIIFPIRPTNSDSIVAFLLLGLNPRRPYDEEYQAFITIMNRQLATSLASIMLFEDEVRRSKTAMEAAALQQEELNAQLAAQTNRLQRMTALSPLGMFYINPEGLILEANDRYYEMTSQDRETMTEMGWMDQLVEGSKQVMAQGWHRMVVDHLPWSDELQLNKKWTDPANPASEPIDYWVLANSQPELTPEGELRSIMGSITDISHLKWAQGLQNRRIQEAEETRRQQNEFIDITSHEMRNPLSAILQCADDISSTMTEYQATATGSIESLIENCIESANTITLCVQHQKNIVDDILTVSKLDSNLLVLTPVVVQPLHVARRSLKMFDSELLAKKIDFEFIVHPSFKRFDVEWASMDPGRMSQIIINLMTNAIKFTSEREKRKIIVAIGVSTSPPITTSTPDFDYIPRKNNTTSSALGDDWSSGESLYVRLKVQDTGCGLTASEKQLLFQRFQQASPRTHAQYGGSGLGLFISRQLTELHGGQIGVSSVAGVGSTFGFFIRARRASPPGSNATTTAPMTVRSPQSSNPTAMPILSHDTSNLLHPVGLSRPIAPLTKVRKIASEKRSILVVEDNLINQKVLMKQLQKAGCEVYVADNGQIALDFLENTEFRKEDGLSLSVVLMDLEMPVMDGLTCVKNIRRMEAEGIIKGHVPVIAITANVRHEQVTTAKESGMDDVVSKPFRIPDLLKRVDILLDESEADTP